MGKIIKLPQTFERNVWALIVIPFVVTIIPYGIIWLIYPPQTVRELLWDVRLLLLYYTLIVGLACKIKIGLVEYKAMGPKWEKRFDIFLTLFGIYPGFLCLLVCYVPTLIILLVIDLIARVSEKIFHRKNFFLLRIVHGVVVIMSYAVSYVVGMTFVIIGEFPARTFFMYANHEGTPDYVGWLITLGFRLSRIVAGDNLMDFPIFNGFLRLKAIIAKGRRKKEWYLIFKKMRIILTKLFTGRAAAISVNNVEAINDMKDCYDNGICVCIGSNGRERRSDNGKLKPHNSAGFGVCPLAVPVMVLGTGRFKPPIKKEPLAKPWYQFQWYCSPRTVYAFIGEPIERLPGENKKVFRDRTDKKMAEWKPELLALLARRQSMRKSWKGVLKHVLRQSYLQFETFIDG